MIQFAPTFEKSINRLNSLSEDTYYNVYSRFQWPESIPEDGLWMSPDLMTAANTPYWDEFSADQLQALSKWESIHFYGLNVHGIRELIVEVTNRIHTPGFEPASEFMHHFIDEENKHMWFFAQFCNRYGKKIYPDIKAKFKVGEIDPDMENFLVFTRILVLEEVVDYFNSRMGNDESLPPIIREINAAHHIDESRHVAFGRQMICTLFEILKDRLGEAGVAEMRTYLKRYMLYTVQSLYNPAVYRDAGIADPYKFRLNLMNHPGRKEMHHKIYKRTLKFFMKNEILEEEEFIYGTV